MGTVTVMLEDLFERLGVEYVAPPPTSAKTLEFGVRHSPEMACLPLKLTIGNLAEGLDAGATATLRVGGMGPCRFGYYADVERRTLVNLGYEFESFTLEPWALVGVRGFVKNIKEVAPHQSVRGIWRALKHSFAKGRALDRVDRKALNIRCYETERGATTRARDEAHRIILDAWTWDEIAEAQSEALALMDRIPQDRERDVLKIGLVGEFYLLLEPFTNFDIEEYLGDRGCFLEKGTYLSDWIGPSDKNPVGGIPDEVVAQAAEPFLEHWVGAEGQAVLGHMELLTREGFDAVVHLMPFTCMPEIIAKSLFPKMMKTRDLPILSLVVDEQTGRAGVHTRLEAFLDLVQDRKARGIAPLAGHA